MNKTLCITGHRRIATEKKDFVRDELHREVQEAINEGYSRFISGFADGTDLEFASIVALIKTDNPTILLEAAIPFPERLKTPDKAFRVLIEQCDAIKITGRAYNSDCYLIRNRYMVEQSERVIAVFNGNKRSGTSQTMRLAQEYGCELHVIDISCPGVSKPPLHLT